MTDWPLPHLTGSSNYFEDLAEGDVIHHARGRTIPDSEHVAFTAEVLNTAQIHFNQDLVENDPAMQRQSGGKRLVVGTWVLAVAMGLSSQDTTENALEVLTLDEARHPAPVVAGDTLYARTTVLSKRASGRPDAGIVRFKLEGLKADRRTVCVEATYEALVKRRAAAVVPGSGSPAPDAHGPPASSERPVPPPTFHPKRPATAGPPGDRP